MALQEAASQSVDGSASGGSGSPYEGALPSDATAGSQSASGQFPVPEVSPRYENDNAALALAETTEATPASAAAMNVAQEGPATGETASQTPAASQQIEINQGAATTASAAAMAQPARPVAANSPSPSAGPSSAPSPAIVTASVQPAPQKPKSFLEQLFGRRDTARSASTSRNPAQPRTASQQRTASAVPGNNGVLPGVRSGKTLFGIDDSEDGHDEENANSGVQVASVGPLGRLISKGGFVLQTERVQADCFPAELTQVLHTIERRYGQKVVITSGYRNPERNRRAGGAKNSMHMYCKAADIQVPGVSKWDLAKYLRTLPGRGGVGTYCRTNSVHIDTGSKRDWHYPCRRGGSKVRKKA
ncbi:MAG: YcbK family protein [Nitratireductor sp.]|nr:YcbK family protein [Nitratireductor sp.]MCC0019679.1 YcbK family protein [Nitratireductor sp.]